MRTRILAAALLAAGSVGLTAAGGASAADVTLWACHGPDGQALGTTGVQTAATGGATAGPAGAGCDGTAAADGLSLALPPTGGAIADDAAAAISVDLPFDLQPRTVSVPWTVGGFAPGSDPGTSLRARVLAGPTTFSEVRSDGPAGTTPAGPSGTATDQKTVAVTLDCDAVTSCAAPAGGTPTVGVRSVALGASDTTGPAGSGSIATEPVRDRTLRLLVNATDDGVGLGSAVVFLDGQLAAQKDLSGGCTDLQPGGTLDLPVGALCRRSVAGDPITIDLTGRTSGQHTVQVVVSDALGNATPLFGKAFTIDDARTTPQQTSVTVTVGTGVPSNPVVTGTGAPTATGAVSRKINCAQPRLSVVLVTPPIAVRGRTLLVHRKGRTFFRGNVTCIVNGARVPGPGGAGVIIRSTFGVGRGLTLQRTGPSLRRDGRFAWTLTRTTTRTLTFRIEPIVGRVVSVSFRLRAVTAKQIAAIRRQQAKAANPDGAR